MTQLETKKADFRVDAIATFAAQPAIRTLGISLSRLEPGEAELSMTYSPAFTQQHGFVHAGIITAGLDNACGIAAFTLTPKGAGILTVEFKTNLLAPARGEQFMLRACGQARTHADLLPSPCLRTASRRRNPGCDHDRHIDDRHVPSLMTKLDT